MCMHMHVCVHVSMYVCVHDVYFCACPNWTLPTVSAPPLSYNIYILKSLPLEGYCFVCQTADLAPDALKMSAHLSAS